MDAHFAGCAALVERADPDRFGAAMAAPPSLRTILFPIYAFNTEVARAPWMTAEPMIAEMRLQWWRDALDEIEQGVQPRRHEVVTPLAAILDAQACATLDRLIAARRWDIYKDPFEDVAAFDAYLDDTAAGLLWTCARLAGAGPDHEGAVRCWGRAMGLANWLRAIPALEAAKRIPLVDGRPEAIQAMAQTALTLPKLRLPKSVAPVMLAAWEARAILRQAAENPMRVSEGSLGQSEFKRRLSLAWAATFGL